MQKLLNAMIFTVMLLLPCSGAQAYAEPYPDTLGNGNYVNVDGGMGIGTYADRSSVVVQLYNPPNYQIAIQVIQVEFSEDYWRQHKTYVGGPYKVIRTFTACFQYNWNRKSIAYLNRYGWMDWNINRFYSHAEGNPFIPLTAETAFVSAYRMRFFDTATGYSSERKSEYRVINESFYRLLGI